MKTTVELPDNLLRQIKLRAVRNGQKLKETIAELLRKGLAASGLAVGPRPIIKTDPQSGFPYFDGPADAPARYMTAAELIDLEHQTQTDEDLERLGVSG